MFVSAGGRRGVVLVPSGRTELFPVSQLLCLSPRPEPVAAHTGVSLCALCLYLE